MSEPDAGAPSAGALLRAAREKQGLHIAALAAAIKVAPRKLDALENDRWEDLPDATFTRALAQTVCRTLKVDPRPVLERLPPAGGHAFDVPSGGLNTPFRDRPGRRDEPGLAITAIKPMVWAAALLMVAALVVLLAPDSLWHARVAAPAGAASAVAPALAAAASAPAEAASLAAGEAAAVEAAASAAAMPALAATPPASAAGEGVVASSGPAPADPPAAAGLLQLHTTAASWIEVRDARGQILLSRTVMPGERVGLDGSLPLKLTIGNAGATQLGFRGRDVDLAPSTRENVARLELQ